MLSKNVLKQQLEQPDKEEKVRVDFYMPHSLWFEFRKKALERRITATELYVETLQGAIKKGDS
ncbi:MAG: hypothetical protein WBF33_25445 [Candidatus Nitrosopolaris sp.]|jgi:hypothetical protein